MKTILVTGGAGFIGSNIVEYLRGMQIQSQQFRVMIIIYHNE